MVKACFSFFERSRITRVVCMLLLVFCIGVMTGCSGDTAPENDGTEAAEAEKMTKGCWTCSLFQKAYSFASSVPVSVIPDVARSAIGLIGIGYGLWLAIFILKQVSSLQEPDAGAFWKALGEQTFWLLMGAALLKSMANSDAGSVYKMFAEPVFSGFIDAGLMIVQGSGGDLPCSPGSGVENGLICLVRALQEKLNFNSGISLIAMLLGPTGFVIFIGLVILIISLILMVYLPIMLLDGVFRYGIALCMLPLAVAAYVFKVTRKFTGKVAILFVEIGFYMIGMCAFSACCVQILGAYIDRFVPFIRNPLFFLKNLDALEQVLCGPGVTGLIFVAFFLILFAEVLSDFMKALSGGAGGMGSTVRETGKQMKSVAQGAKMVASFGVNRIQRRKDRKAARDYMNAPEGSGKKELAQRRMEERGYLTRGENGQLQRTAAFMDLTKNDRMTGPFKGIRKTANYIQDLSSDMHSSILGQSEWRHDHSKDGNKVIEDDKNKK